MINTDSYVYTSDQYSNHVLPHITTVLFTNWAWYELIPSQTTLILGY
jgi:hypothetical protein